MNHLERLNDDLAILADQVRRGIVQVRNGRGSGGTGVIARTNGIIVTNAHVVRSRSPHVILADGRSLPAQILAHDTQRDLAILAVKSDNLPVVPFGDASGLRPGDWVMSVGHPWGIVGAATAGVIVSTPGNRNIDGWLVAAIHLRPGNSGGPLVNTKGAVVGIGTMVIGTDLAFAVPVEAVRVVLRETGFPVPVREVELSGEAD